MKFPKGIPLETFLSYVRTAVTTAAGREIDVYLDPLGLAEVEKTPQSPITFDVEHIPAGEGLSLALEQLGLTYVIENGLVSIKNVDDVATVFDYRLLLAHCLLAWLAAGLGAVLVPIVAGRRVGEGNERRDEP
jgi:hypothetical protein